MPIAVNGVEQPPEEVHKALLKLQSGSKFGIWGFWVAIVSLIVAIIAITIAII